MMQEHHIPVARTARYFTLGDLHGAPREVWYVCHGYGQLAARFLRRFAPLDDGTRLIVAPEALSRFYVEIPGARGHADAPVGATWMTREDRLSEIDDYIRYLDALHALVRRSVRRDGGAEVVLGFSQGVATVCRWIARGAVRPSRVILWGGVLPGDLDLEADGAALRRQPLALVYGDDDALVGAEALAEQSDRLARYDVPFREIRYRGGHRIEADALVHVAEG